jgi:hypothetical protein
MKRSGCQRRDRYYGRAKIRHVFKAEYGDAWNSKRKKWRLVKALVESQPVLPSEQVSLVWADVTVVPYDFRATLVK